MVIKLIGIKGTIKVNYFDVTLISSVSFQKTNVFKITNLSTSKKKYDKTTYDNVITS